MILGANRSEGLINAVVFAALHEAAHLFALLCFKEKPREINVGVFGMEIRRAGNVGLSYRREILVSLAGPALNTVLAAAFILLGRERDIIAVNLSMAALNFLPVTPLDGGRALYFWLCGRMAEEKARKITEGAGIITLFPLSFLGFTVLIRSGYNFTLLAVCVYLILLLIFGQSIL